MRADETTASRRRQDLQRYQFGAFVLAAAGLIVGAALLPGGDELLLIHVKNRHIEPARALLADSATHGVSTIASVVAHHELYLLEGRVDEALIEMEAYARAHPRDADAWTRLARMYAEAQRLDDQLRAVAHVYRLDPSAASARSLLTLVRWTGDETTEATVLRDLVINGTATADESVRSARLEAAFGRAPQAFDAMERLRRRAPGAFDYAATELYASLLLATQGTARLAGPIQLLPLVQDDPDILMRLAGTLNSWGRPDAAVALFDSRPGSEPSAERLAMRARTAIGTSEAGRVAGELTRLDGVRPLAPAPLEALVALLLSRGDYPTAAAVLGNPGRPADVALARQAIGHAIARDRRDHAQTLIARLGDQSLTDSPVLALELAVERGDIAGAERWIGRLDAASDTSAEQRVAIAQFESRIGHPDRAFVRLAGLLRDGAAPEWAASDFTHLAQRLGRVEEAVSLLETASSLVARDTWARLVAFSDKPDRLEGWLTTGARDRDYAPTLRDVYFLLSDRGHADLAVRAAEQLVSTRGTDGDGVLLARALLAASRPVEALLAIRRTSLAGADAQLAYEDALLAARQAGADVGVELRRVFQQRLSSGDLQAERRPMLVEGLWAAGERASLLDVIAGLARRDLDRWLSPLIESAQAACRPQRAIDIIAAALPAPVPGSGQTGQAAPVPQKQIDLVRALMELDAPDAVLLPHLRHLSDALGDSWVYAYDERLVRRSDTAARGQLWTRVASRADASPEARRAAAFRLIELGSTALAADVLLSLAAESGPADADVRLLISLWGTPIANRPFAWLMQRLAASQGDRPQWLAHITTLADAQQLRAVAAAVLADPRADIEEFRLIGRSALARALPDVAETAFDTVLGRHPTDREALRWLGAIAFYDGRTERARTRLEAYAATGADEAEPIYQLGELVRGEGDTDRARGLYRQVLSRLGHPVEAQAHGALLANVLVRLDDRPRAVALFDQLLRHDPTLEHVRADYAAALLNWGDYGRAWAILRDVPQVVGGNSNTLGDASGMRRLALLRVQWLMYAGRYGDAVRELDQLAQRFPTDPDVLLARAGVDADLHRTSAAERGYRLARTHAPQRQDIGRLLDQRARQQAPRATFEAESRTITDGWRERSERMNLAAHAASDAPWSLSIERRRLVAPRTRRTDGTIAPLDVAVNRLEATVTVPFPAETTRTAASVFAAASGLGAGFTLSHEDLRGRLEATAEVGRPFWDFLESAAGDGRRDRVGLQRQWRFRADTAAWVIAGWNQYRLADGPRAATTAFTFGVVRTVRRRAPAITLQYGLDKEHRLSATAVTRPEGETFLPIPLVSREVHVVGAVGRTGAGRFGEFETGAGYTVDRLGGRGSFFTARLSSRDNARVNGAAWVDRRLFTIATSQQVVRTGAQLSVRF